MASKKASETEYIFEYPAMFKARLIREGRHALLYTTLDPTKKHRTPRPFKIYCAKMSSRGSGSPASSRSSKKSNGPKQSVQQLVDYLNTHRINTLTELCRIERVAASCENEDDARAFQEPMTSAWVYYVTTNQLLIELRGLTRDYPFSGDIVHEAHRRVRADPESNRSWNLAWLCLTRMRDDGLIEAYAAVEAVQPEMWGDMEPSPDDVDRLAECFEKEWTAAVHVLLRHWPTAPTWY